MTLLLPLWPGQNAHSGTASQSLKRGGEKNTKSINVLRDLSAVNIFSYYWRCKSSDLISFAVEQTAVTAGHLKLSPGPYFLLQVKMYHANVPIRDRSFYLNFLPLNLLLEIVHHRNQHLYTQTPIHFVMISYFVLNGLRSRSGLSGWSGISLWSWWTVSPGSAIQTRDSIRSGRTIRSICAISSR